MSLVTLKDGQTVHLRKITLNDVEQRHEFFVNLSMAQAGMVHTIDEIDIHTHETYDKIHDFIKNRRGLWLVAISQQNNIIGEIDILVKNLSRIRHNGQLTIGILPTYCGLGLGTSLMEQALLWAQQQQLLRIELSVFSTNLRAQKLYKKFGFIIEGVRKNYLRHEDGSFEDDLMMAKYC